VNCSQSIDLERVGLIRKHQQTFTPATIPAMLEYPLQGFNGYAVKYSPFIDNRIAIGAAANFGLVGNGRLFILRLTANGIQPEKWYVFHPE
jgi:hypothetical protein